MRFAPLALALVVAAASPGPQAGVWPDAVLRHPGHPNPVEQYLNPQWFGDWRASDGRTIKVSVDAFVFHSATGETEHASWLKHAYDWQWARDLGQKIAAGKRPGGVGPGSYIGYAPPSVTDADVAHDFDLARSFLKSQQRLDRDAESALDALKAAASGIRKGTYRRVMRYCFDPPNAAADCGPVDLLSYYILDEDRRGGSTFRWSRRKKARSWFLRARVHVRRGRHADGGRGLARIRCHRRWPPALLPRPALLRHNVRRLPLARMARFGGAGPNRVNGVSQSLRSGATSLSPTAGASRAEDAAA